MTKKVWNKKVTKQQTKGQNKIVVSSKECLDLRDGLSVKTLTCKKIKEEIKSQNSRNYLLDMVS